jgi:hypothetical protein
MTVKEITSDGVCYVTDSGENAFVGFNECNENWLQFRKKKELLSDAQMEEMRKTDRIVGQRDVNTLSSYIELFARPFVRFSFVPEQMKEYEDLRDAIWFHGWTTFDLS